uniref:Uncharacterized protein n=1 Tax=Grammatophora oceanica TaxID=210454 RepID=A0A7S1YCX9_9STRA
MAASDATKPVFKLYADPPKPGDATLRLERMHSRSLSADWGSEAAASAIGYMLGDLDIPDPPPFGTAGSLDDLSWDDSALSRPPPVEATAEETTAFEVIHASTTELKELSRDKSSSVVGFL